MDKRVLRERMRRKQRQLRRRKIMRLVGYVLGVVLVVTFLVRGVILPIARGIGGKDADKPVEIQAETETVEADPDAAIRKPLKGKGDLTKASDLTAGWHEDENGKWYQNFDGTYYAGGFQEIDGVTYSFDDNGYIQTGWVSNGFDDLYFNEDGSYNPDKHKTRIALTLRRTGRIYRPASGLSGRKQCSRNILYAGTECGKLGIHSTENGGYRLRDR